MSRPEPEARKIFICYRHKDRKEIVDRIADRLAIRLSSGRHGSGRVIRDISTLKGGDHFVKELGAALDEANALVAVITPDWLEAKDDSGRRRLDAPNDWVRTELEVALHRKHVKIVPLLIDGAIMPIALDLPMGIKELAYRHALELPKTPTDLDYDKLAWEIITSVDEACRADVAVSMVTELGNQLKEDAGRITTIEESISKLQGNLRGAKWTFGVLAAIVVAGLVVAGSSIGMKIESRVDRISSKQDEVRKGVTAIEKGLDVIGNKINTEVIQIFKYNIAMDIDLRKDLKDALDVTLKFKFERGKPEGYEPVAILLENETGASIVSSKVQVADSDPGHDLKLDVVFVKTPIPGKHFKVGINRPIGNRLSISYPKP
jgi:hypothetical protein